MTNTYDPDMSEKKDEVRFKLGDTESPWLLSDEEIYAVLTKSSSGVNEASRRCCAAIIAKLGRSGASTSVGPFSVSKGELVSHYRELMQTLSEERSLVSPVSPYVGGMYEADRDDFDNSTLIKHTFTQGMFDSTIETANDPRILL